MLVSPAAVMSAKEYYNSAPGQQVQSPDSLWKPGGQRPLGPPRRKSSRDDYISPGDPAFTLTNFPSSTVAGAGTNINSNADGAALSPPPKPIPTPMPHDHLDAMRSPPAPQSPDGSQVTDESDDSLVHIHRPGSRSQPPPPPPPAPRPRSSTSNPRRSDSLNLTQSNLQQLNAGHGTSSIVTPLRGSYSHFISPSSSRKRLRAKELSTHGKDTLIQMLVKQESSADDAKKSLRGALDKLEQYKLDLLEANNHCRRLERACQKLTDERMLLHTQVTETMGKAQQQALTAQQELAVCRLRLEHTEQALATANADLRQAKLQATTSNLETERLRNELHHLREQTNVHEAREQGRKQGYDEGVQQGRVVSLNTQPARQITQTGDPTSTAVKLSNTSAADMPGLGGAFIEEEANTTHQSIPSAPSGSHQGVPGRSSSRASTSSSRTSRDPRVLKASFESALSQARQETELRLQRELENQLNTERHRLQLLNVQHEQTLERASRDQADQFQKLLTDTQQQTHTQMQELKDMQTRLQEELRKEKERVERVRGERNQERERREREEKERRREREDRERERQGFIAEQSRLADERERERRKMAQKDAERDRLVAEANTTAAQAVQAASAASAAAAAASASAAAGVAGGSSTRPSSTTSNSNSNSDHEQSFSTLRSFGVAPMPIAYIPMPRPPVGMPVPSSATQPATPATVAMPEPSFPSSLVNNRPLSRSAQQPALPQTVPARQGPVGGGRNRRSSLESQSTISTVAGALDSLVSFPHAVPSIPLSSGRASSTDSAGGGGASRGGSNSRGGPGGGAGIYGRPYSGGARDGPYGNPEREKERSRDMLSDIPEDASVRSALSPPLSSSSRVRPSSPMIIPPLPVLNSSFAPTVSGASSGRPQLRPNQRQRQQPPSWYPDSTTGGNEDSSDDDGGPVIPTIRVDAGDAGRDNWRSGEREDDDDDQPVDLSLLNPGGPGANLRRSDSENSARPSIRSTSSYEIVVEPPSNPTSPREERRDPHSELHHHGGPEGHHEQQPVNPHQYLSPLHATVPIPPVQVPSQPVLPRRTESPALPVRNPNERQQQRSRTRTQTSSSSGSRGWGYAAGGGENDDDNESSPTEPNSPVIPSTETHNLPPGFVPRVFTPNAAPSSLPPVNTVSESLPPGFVPQSITDAATGITTPLMGMSSALPNVGGGAGGAGNGAPVIGARKNGSGGQGSGGGGSTTNSRRASAYGNPVAGGGDDWSNAAWGSNTPGSGSNNNTNTNKPGFSPYLTSSSLPAGPPVIPSWGNDSDSDPQQQASRSASASGRNTPGSRTRSIYGTPSALGGSRNLPSGSQTPVDGGVYQNPLRRGVGEGDFEGEGDGDADDLVARNTKINATAPLPGGRKKKKKGGK